MKPLRTLVPVLLLAMNSPFTTPAAAEDPWKSIDDRANPAWWGEAKFGLFIHWGPYAVPAFSAPGEYAEWYWRALKDPQRDDHEAVKAFHAATYGSDFDYQDFAPRFAAELFDAEAWARTFPRSGAGYIVITSKHHDGFALWPSADASRSWGRPWNAQEVGPQRDLLAELSTATRAAGLRFGIYYSLYEWFNPLYLENPDRYVAEHMIPQFKDVVTRYHPSVVFSDGAWEHPSTTWRSTELLNWLLNESPSAADVVMNDRWGEESRHVDGG